MTFCPHTNWCWNNSVFCAISHTKFEHFASFKYLQSKFQAYAYNQLLSLFIRPFFSYVWFCACDLWDVVALTVDVLVSKLRGLFQSLRGEYSHVSLIVHSWVKSPVFGCNAMCTASVCWKLHILHAAVLCCICLQVVLTARLTSGFQTRLVVSRFFVFIPRTWNLRQMLTLNRYTVWWLHFAVENISSICIHWRLSLCTVS